MKAAKTRALNAKHAGTRKHTGTAKHTPSAHKKAATGHQQKARRSAATVKAAKARALGDVACCCAEAVAASARLAGHAVSPLDVLGLYRRTADSPGAGASLAATLEAALAFGLAGVRPLWFGERPLDHVPLPFGERLGHVEEPDLGEINHGVGDRLAHGLILGLDLPEAPHAVTLGPSGAVWSWGALHEMTAEAVVEEAWAVTWP